jgi:hypothetical protein
MPGEAACSCSSCSMPAPHQQNLSSPCPRRLVPPMREPIVVTCGAERSRGSFHISRIGRHQLPVRWLAASESTAAGCASASCANGDDFRQAGSNALSWQRLCIEHSHTKHRAVTVRTITDYPEHAPSAQPVLHVCSDQQDQSETFCINEWNAHAYGVSSSAGCGHLGLSLYTWRLPAVWHMLEIAI